MFYLRMRSNTIGGWYLHSIHRTCTGYIEKCADNSGNHNNIIIVKQHERLRITKDEEVEKQNLAYIQESNPNNNCFYLIPLLIHCMNCAALLAFCNHNFY